jgi:hypothetical protein
MFASLLDRWLRRDSLSRVDGPARVRLQGTIACKQLVTSPLSGLRTAHLQSAFFVQMFTDRQNRQHTVYAPLGTSSLGGDLVVLCADGAVEVPMAHAEMTFEGAAGYGTAVDRELPASMDWVKRHRLESSGPLFVRELYLAEGESIELTATVRRLTSERAGAGPFRAAQAEDGPRFRACPELGDIRLVQRVELASG